MLTSQQMDFLPVWFISLLAVLLVSLAVEIGMRFGKYAQLHWADQSTDLNQIMGDAG